MLQGEAVVWFHRGSLWKRKFGTPGHPVIPWTPSLLASSTIGSIPTRNITSDTTTQWRDSTSSYGMKWPLGRETFTLITIKSK